MSPKLRASLPILEEQSSSGMLECLKMPQMAALSLPLGAHLQPPDLAFRPPPAQRHLAARKDARQPQTQPSESLFSTIASPPLQRPVPTITSSASYAIQQQLHQQALVSGLDAPAEAAGGSTPADGMAGHQRSASGQEQGLAMAEQVISAYNLGMQNSCSITDNAAAKGAPPQTPPPIPCLAWVFAS